MARVDDPVSVVEAAWRLDGDDATWLSGVGEAAHRCLDAGGGAYVFRWGFPRGRFEIRDTRVVSGDPRACEAIVRLNAEAPTEALNLFLYAVPCGVIGQLVPGGVADDPAWRRHCHPLGFHDAIGLNPAQPDNTGFHVCIPLRSAGRWTPEETRRWQRVVVHLAAADRLRRALSNAPAEPEAILSTNGRTLHAEEGAKDASARTALREAVVRMERARTRKARRTGEALEGWRAMVSARWSLLDVFERDGRRYVVARPNAPQVEAPQALTVRERQVAAFASMGHSNKLIAYELGLSPSTVATHLGKVMAKLGVKSRMALLHRLRLPSAAE